MVNKLYFLQSINHSQHCTIQGNNHPLMAEAPIQKPPYKRFFSRGSTGLKKNDKVAFAQRVYTHLQTFEMKLVNIIFINYASFAYFTQFLMLLLGTCFSINMANIVVLLQVIKMCIQIILAATKPSMSTFQPIRPHFPISSDQNFFCLVTLS